MQSSISSNTESLKKMTDNLKCSKINSWYIRIKQRRKKKQFMYYFLTLMVRIFVPFQILNIINAPQVKNYSFLKLEF